MNAAALSITTGLVSAFASKMFSLKSMLALTRGVLATSSILTFAIAVHPEWRESVRNQVRQDYRQVLSTARAKLAGSDFEYTIAKIKTRDALFLEIYETLSEGGSRLVEKIVLPDSRDGYFSFNGKSTNLAIDDIDEDGRPEILAPSFDNNLVGHLNVYSFNVEKRGFDPVIR